MKGVKCKMPHFIAKIPHFIAKMAHSIAKMAHFIAKTAFPVQKTGKVSDWYQSDNKTGQSFASKR